MNFTAANVRDMVTAHRVVQRSLTAYEMDALDDVEVDAWAAALGLAVLCTAYYCGARPDDGSHVFHATQAEVDACVAASEAAEAVEAEWERGVERAARHYDECGDLLWDDEALADACRY